METSRRPLFVVAIAAAALFVLGACERTPRIGTDGDGPGVTVLEPSTQWQGQVPADEFAARVEQLTGAIEQLREDTGSGWVGRQDDVTGYLAQLSGGAYRGGDNEADGAAADVAAAFLSEYAQSLFGVAGDALELPDDVEPDAAGFAVLRTQQVVDEVPVVDGVLNVTVSDAEGEPRVSALLGHVFPGLDVDTEPRLSAAQARRAAARAARGDVLTEPELTVLPVGAGQLCWMMTVSGSSLGGETSVDIYFIDATSGEIAATRPTSPESATLSSTATRLASAATARAGQPAEQTQGEPVSVTGTDPYGQQVTAVGTLRPDGTVVLIDTTTPFYDPATGAGAVETYDATGLRDGDEARLPGRPVRADGGTVESADAIAAHAYSRYVTDYYLTTFGRRSWDAEGGSLQTSVHFGESTDCNAYFGLQMVYTLPCVVEGAPQSLSMVDPDVAAHELTHGVTSTSSNLLYTGQTGALNEGFSDYFGNVIGDALLGRDSNGLAESMCSGFTAETQNCHPNAEGGFTFRYMLNGATMEDYVPLLDTPLPLSFGLGLSQDNGGVHVNSAVWNNATWTIRGRLAQIDGTSMLESPRARAFDQMMYAALTRHLTPTSGFLDARAAVEAAATELAVDPVVLETTREVFDLNGICVGCAAADTGPAVPVVLDAATQKYAVVSPERYGWLSYEGVEYAGDIVTRGAGETASTRVPGADQALSLAMAGETFVSLRERDGQVLWHGDAGSAPRSLGPALADLDSQVIGVAGSPEGAAWADISRGTLAFVDPGGTVTTTQLPEAARGETFYAIATGGGAVALGSMSGVVIRWDVGAQPVVLDRGGEHPVLGIGVHGARVITTTADLERLEGRSGTIGPVFLYDGSERRQLSSDSAPFGAAVNQEYAVWAQEIGSLGGAIAETDDETYADTALYLYSFASGTTYLLFDQSGQQGFPALAGNRLVWLDSAAHGNDVFTGVIPSGL